jgi:hypothetical protein
LQTFIVGNLAFIVLRKNFIVFIFTFIAESLTFIVLGNFRKKSSNTPPVAASFQAPSQTQPWRRPLASQPKHPPPPSIPPVCPTM